MDVRYRAFADALEGFVYLVRTDMAALSTQLDARLIDGLENGKAQKFQYCLELCWKAIKSALKEREGIDEASPKKAIKAWYLTGHLSEDSYLALIAAVAISTILKSLLRSLRGCLDTPRLCKMFYERYPREIDVVRV